MKFIKPLLVCLLLATAFKGAAQTSFEWKTATAAGYTYKYVTNDPLQARFYTLKNGLTVILSPNNKEPRIVYKMAVRAGSNTDPKDHTGLAHYLEHLLFKGTDKYGTQNWEKEKPFIDTIFNLYEQYNSTNDSAKRTAIYKEIDRVSNAASQYSITGEYIKMMGDIGSQRTNAHTAAEETVYEEDIPSDQVDKFLTVQAERFRNPIFRLFHTELEAVYEEKNRALDNDGFKLFETMNAAVFPTHNYGQQTVIGTIEHLKNPSLKAIKEYYDKWYVPNNMALILVGDFNPDEMIKKAEKYFSYMKPKEIIPYAPAPEAPMTSVVEKTIYSNTPEMVRISFRTPAANAPDAILLDMASKVLFNGKAGLLDINITKQQKAVNASTGTSQYKDYGIVSLSAASRPGQTLEQVRDLLLEQLQKLKAGEFDESIIKAILANGKLNFYTGLETSNYRAAGLMDAFIKNRGEKWDLEIGELESKQKITKAQIVDAANRYFGNGYALIYKRKGSDNNIVKVQKPAITPVKTNTDKESDFLKSVTAMKNNAVTPQWKDFTKDFQRSKAGIANIMYVQNTENEKFRLHYRYDMGSRNNLLLPVAAQYIQFLGTDKYTAEQISKEFYNIACSFNLNAQAEAMAINLTGLNENFDKAVALLEHVLANCQPNEAALAGLKGRLLKTRNDAKANKTTVMNGLIAYARFGLDNPFNNVLSNDDIQAISAQELVNLLHSLVNYQHDIIYYGPTPLAKFATDITAAHKLPASFVPYPAGKKFAAVTQIKNEVLFTDFEMVQAEINWIRNTEKFDEKKSAVRNVFNNYFGAGGNSLVFQTIRESKALAYSSNASYVNTNRLDEPCYFGAYVGCQADKMNDALAAMNELINNMPLDEKKFDVAKSKRIAAIETDRTSGADFIFDYLALKQLGIDYDPRKSEYEAINAVTLNDVVKFEKEQIAGKPFTYCIIGSEGKVKRDDLQKLGEVKKLSLEEIFGY